MYLEECFLDYSFEFSCFFLGFVLKKRTVQVYNFKMVSLVIIVAFSWLLGASSFLHTFEPGSLHSLHSSQLDPSTISITSARFYPSSIESTPADSYFHRMFEKREFSDRLCFIELYGTVPKQLADFEISNTSEASMSSGLGFEWECKFYVDDLIRRQYIKNTLKAIYYFCFPLLADRMHQSCESIQSNDEQALKFTLTLAKMNQQHFLLKTQFVLNPPSQYMIYTRRLDKNFGNELGGIVATAPYMKKNKNMGILIGNWIYYHLRLGFRVFFYDRNGLYKDEVMDAVPKFVTAYCANKEIASYGANKENYFFSYLNSLLFSSQSACMEYHKSRLLNRLEYFDYTLRGLLNLNDRAQEKAKTGQDKHLTYSHCRFEHQKRGESDEDYGGVSSLLVVDFDEYVFCSSAGLSKSHQSGAILNLLDKTHNDQTMIFRRAVGNKTSTSSYGDEGVIESLSDCHQRTYESNSSVFSCYQSWIDSMKHLTIKSWHHSSICLPTDYHAACHPGCKCKSKISNKCGLFHLRPQRYQEIKAENKTYKMFQSHAEYEYDNDNKIDSSNNGAIDDAAIGIVEVRGGKKKVENELAVVWLVDD